MQPLNANKRINSATIDTINFNAPSKRLTPTSIIKNPIIMMTAKTPIIVNMSIASQ